MQIQNNVVHTSSPSLFKIPFNIILPFTAKSVKCPLSRKLPNQNCEWISILFHKSYKPKILSSFILRH
jgi:hypothetical protein